MDIRFHAKSISRKTHRMLRIRIAKQNKNTYNTPITTNINIMDDCVFCKIIKGEIQHDSFIYEDDYSYVFLSSGPVNFGHTLVIPKGHYANIYEMPDEAMQKLAITVRNASRSVKEATEAHGINIMMNNDRPAGQVVFHAHFHIIPRFQGDGFKHWESKIAYKKGQAAETAGKIKEKI